MRNVSKRLLITLCTCFAMITACYPAATRSTPTSLASPPVLTQECAPGMHNNQLTSGIATREYHLYIPASYRPDHPTPLILGFHGNTDHAQSFEAYSKLSPLAEQVNFIAAYMQGAGDPPTWDTGENSGDVLYVKDVLDYIQTICNIDADRIYAIGHSLGGGIVHRLACEMADRFAAIATQAGAYQNSEPCKPARAIPIITIHGTGDTIVSYDGFWPNDETPGDSFTLGMSIPQWAAHWADINGCDSQSTVIFQQDPISGQQWSNCSGEADVVLYTVRDGRHGWPTPSIDFDAARTIWDFFVRHPLKPASQ